MTSGRPHPPKDPEAADLAHRRMLGIGDEVAAERKLRELGVWLVFEKKRKALQETLEADGVQDSEKVAFAQLVPECIDIGLSRARAVSTENKDAAAERTKTVVAKKDLAKETTKASREGAKQANAETRLLKEKRKNPKSVKIDCSVFAGKKCTNVQMNEWVASNLRADVKAEDVPSAKAWNLLLTARGNQEWFFEKFMKPTRTEIAAGDAHVDDGAEVQELIIRCRIGYHKAKGT